MVASSTKKEQYNIIVVLQIRTTKVKSFSNTH